MSSGDECIKKTIIYISLSIYLHPYPYSGILFGHPNELSTDISSNTEEP
jgi:hypothetical protein